MLDRLIQLQPRTAGIEIREPRPQAAPLPTKAGLPTAAPTSLKAAPPPQPANGLFGAGALRKPAGNAEPTAVEPPWKQRELANAQPSATGTPGGDGQPPRLFMLPRELIFFIRENREWVIGGSLSALALFWAASTAFTRRRSRAHG